MMKKLINGTDAVVAESLRGFEAAHGDIVRVNYDPAYIVRADSPVSGKVGVLSGGGSGHEPMHGGFVGMGMLDAACPGEVFTSPTPDQMYEATKAIDGGAGVLHIVKNYTGDVLNFEMAADLARADGIEVEAVVTDDDVAVQDSTCTAGRRGVGVTVLAEKIVGAAAEEGRAARGGRRAVPEGERRGPQHGHGAHVLHGARGGHARPSSSATTRWRSASASTASPDASACRSRRRTRWSRCSRTPSWRTCRSRRATGSWRSSTEWEARRCSSCTSSTTSCGRCSPSAGST